MRLKWWSSRRFITDVGTAMKRILIWDLPVRLFHWLFAASFLVAFLIATTVDDESSVFAVHMLLGGALAFMVLLRLVWGLVGTRWARLSSFRLNPKELMVYLVSAVTRGAKRYAGHNPGSSIAAVLMFILILGLAITGIMMGSGGGEAAEEIHEILAWSMLAVVGAHLLGIAVHTVRHREFIAASMIDGRKEAEPANAISSVRPVVGLLFLALTALWVTGLVRGYDANTGRVTLPLVGQTLQVGEGHEHGEAERANYEMEAGDHD